MTMNPIPEILKVLRNQNFNRKVFVTMNKQVAGNDFDGFENNYQTVNLNPICLPDCYVRELTPETAFWKQYGLHLTGAREIICEDRFRSFFENCNQITIDGILYQPFKGGTGNRTMISGRPGRLIRVVCTRAD